MLRRSLGRAALGRATFSGAAGGSALIAAAVAFVIILEVLIVAAAVIVVLIVGVYTTRTADLVLPVVIPFGSVTILIRLGLSIALVSRAAVLFALVVARRMSAGSAVLRRLRYCGASVAATAVAAIVTAAAVAAATARAAVAAATARAAGNVARKAAVAGVIRGGSLCLVKGGDIKPEHRHGYQGQYECNRAELPFCYSVSVHVIFSYH